MSSCSCNRYLPRWCDYCAEQLGLPHWSKEIIEMVTRNMSPEDTKESTRRIKLWLKHAQIARKAPVPSTKEVANDLKVDPTKPN
jgi:hypothetical protein